MRTKQRIEALEAAVPREGPLTPDELHRLVAAATDINELSDEVLQAIVNCEAGLPLDAPPGDEQLMEAALKAENDEADQWLDALIAASRRQEPGA